METLTIMTGQSQQTWASLDCIYACCDYKDIHDINWQFPIDCISFANTLRQCTDVLMSFAPELQQYVNMIDLFIILLGLLGLINIHTIGYHICVLLPFVKYYIIMVKGIVCLSICDHLFSMFLYGFYVWIKLNWILNIQTNFRMILQ